MYANFHNNLFNGILSPTCEAKDNDKSLHFRQLGNAQFAKKNTKSFLLALPLYNQAICYAVTNSEDLSFGYANRSAVYFKMKLYEECLASIDMAKAQSGFPDRLQSKLQERQAKAVAAIAQLIYNSDDQRGPIEPKLCKPPHEKIPFIVNCLELQRNGRYGRYVTTKEDLKVGDIIAIERPFCTALTRNMQYQRCENCCMEKAQNLLPCDTCTAVMFCGEECRREAVARFHKYECPVIDFLRRKLPSTDMRIAVRTTLCALSEFKTLDALVAFAEEANTRDHNLFTMDYSSGTVGAKERYGPVYAMQIADETPYSRHVVNNLMYLVCMQLLRQSKVDGFSFSANTCKTLLKFMHRHFHVTMLNRCAVSDVGLAIDEARIEKKFDHDDLTLGMFPFRFLLNHACVPNIVSSSLGNQFVFSVIKPIKAGEQISDCYVVHHSSESIQQRKILLPFKCDCIACQKDYPLLTRMRSAAQPPSQQLWKDSSNLLLSCDREAAFAIAKMVADYLQEHDKEYPTKQLVMMAGYYLHILGLLYCKEIPLDARFLPIEKEAAERMKMVNLAMRN